MIDLGAEWPIAVNIVGADGQPVNPSTATLTIQQPDGTTVTVPVTLPVPAPLLPGQIRSPWLPTMPGRHIARLVTTGPNTAWTDEQDVQPAFPPSIISLADAKQQLGIPLADTRDDDEIRAKLAGITASIENYLHKTVAMATFSEETIVESLWRPGLKLRLLHIPVITLLSVAASDGSYTWDTAGLDVDKLTGLVSVISGAPLKGRITATYTAGMQIIPGNIIEGAKVLFQHVWETRRGPGGTGVGVIGPEEAQDWRHYTAWPRKVSEWLGPPLPVVM